MKNLLVLFLLTVFACEKEGTVLTESQEVGLPYTSLKELSPESYFIMRCLTSSYEGEAREQELVVINDEEAYYRELGGSPSRPKIDFSTHTLLAVGLMTRGSLSGKLIKDGDRLVLKVRNGIPTVGPQGTWPHLFSALIPKIENTEVALEIQVIKEN
jgi:hypothetical protein